MQADKDDAPWSVRQRRKDSAALQLLSLIIGCIAIGGVLLLNSERLSTPVTPPLPTASSLPATPAHTAPGIPAAPAATAPAAAATAGSRQTEFNAQNYQPRTDINTIQSIRSRPVQTSSTAGAAPPRIMHSDRWHWEFAGSSRAGTFIWHEQGGRIDWSSVCSNYRTGALEYRDCRKAAKRVFARLCSRNAQSPACAAARSYNPLSG